MAETNAAGQSEGAEPHAASETGEIGSESTAPARAETDELDAASEGASDARSPSTVLDDLHPRSGYLFPQAETAASMDRVNAVLLTLTQTVNRKVWADVNKKLSALVDEYWLAKRWHGRQPSKAARLPLITVKEAASDLRKAIAALPKHIRTALLFQRAARDLAYFEGLNDDLVTLQKRCSTLLKSTPSRGRRPNEHIQLAVEGFAEIWEELQGVRLVRNFEYTQEKGAFVFVHDGPRFIQTALQAADLDLDFASINSVLKKLPASTRPPKLVEN